MNNNKFIKEVDNFLSSEECDRFIRIYNELERQGFTSVRRVPHAKDTQVAIHEAIYNGYVHEIPGHFSLIQKLSQRFFEGPYREYTDRYHVLNEGYEKHNIRYMKLQKTLPGQGYHSWHSEDASKTYVKRLFAFSIYLNDVKEGGETEFLYLSKRIKAVKGRLSFFPVSFEYTHRGNPPISNEKYILTGWVEFI
jgi:hypothetical protein